MHFKDTIYNNRTLEEDFYSPKTGELLCSRHRRLNAAIINKIESHGGKILKKHLHVPYQKERLKRIKFIQERIETYKKKLERWEDEYEQYNKKTK